MAVDDETGEVWVADAWNQRFSRFSATGVPMGTWGHRGPGGPFDMNYPRHIQIQPANTAACPAPTTPSASGSARSVATTCRCTTTRPRARPPATTPPRTDGACAPTYVTQIGEIGDDNIEPNHFRWPVDIEFYTRPDGTEIAVIGDRMASSVKFFNARHSRRSSTRWSPTPATARPMIPRPNHGTAIDPATGNITW